MVSGQWSVVSGQWSVVSGQWSVVSGQWSVVSGQWSVVSENIFDNWKSVHCKTEYKKAFTLIQFSRYIVMLDKVSTRVFTLHFYVAIRTIYISI